MAMQSQRRSIQEICFLKLNWGTIFIRVKCNRDIRYLIFKEDCWRGIGIVSGKGVTVNLEKLSGSQTQGKENSVKGSELMRCLELINAKPYYGGQEWVALMWLIGILHDGVRGSSEEGSLYNDEERETSWSLDYFYSKEERESSSSSAWWCSDLEEQNAQLVSWQVWVTPIGIVLPD